MKIINETCYNTEDMEALFEKCKTSVELCRPIWLTNNRWELPLYAVPTSIRMGYYKPTHEKDRWSGRRNYLNKTGWGDNIRLGIVRPSALGVSPLVALAQAADGANLRLPAEVVHALAERFCSFISYASIVNIADYKSCWSWLDTFEVRYRARAKRGSRAKVKRAREIAMVSKLESQVHSAESQISSLERQLYQVRRENTQREATLAKLKKDLGI